MYLSVLLLHVQPSGDTHTDANRGYLWRLFGGILTRQQRGVCPVTMGMVELLVALPVALRHF